MFRDELRTLWAEPRAPGAPARVPGDWLLLAAGLTATALEASFREQVTWRPVSTVLTVGLCLLVLWRRTHPLAMVVLAFGGGVLLTLIDVLTGHTAPIGLRAGIIVLFLVHALTRWGSGREIVLGSVVILASFAVSSIVEGGPAGDIIGGLSFLAFPAALGGFVRLRTTSRRRELEQMRARERESIARELHDTVAHHVSAIVVRAQAGRVLAGLDPSTADETLAGVEEEGARTLEAMRAMVKALRTAETDAELKPLPGTADLKRLARDRPGDAAGGIPIDLRLDGPAENLPQAVDTAVYRIVQESVTNATRHATGATLVEVRVTVEPDRVRIAVRDDGAIGGHRPRRSGFDLTDDGIVGSGRSADGSSSRGGQRRGGFGLAGDGLAGDGLAGGLVSTGRSAHGATGGDGPRRHGFGLVGLEERAALLGGVLRAGPCRDGGWVVEAELPLSGVKESSPEGNKGSVHPRAHR
ncbi:histidine kinase [Actinoplanes sp. KI2]|uniref:sensor histidine kinase n=1 Tax=Actinoplanes sp. KI2 TaxID=2983315 RepID=UPI0021D57AD4|nr:histidine kinase [Actinoplanes sp. KI2]MCU7727286.1 histidine kinase [Actinoplanes sp. KI2]